MAVRTRVTSIARRLRVALDERTSGEARSRRLAEVSIAAAREAQQQNSALVGRTVDYETFVDGAKGASEYSVKPDGRIVHEFSDGLRVEVIRFILDQLRAHAPVLSGRYEREIRMYADGAEVKDPVVAARSDGTMFTVTVPYARKIEGNKIPGRKRAPLSAQAPEGVFAAVALLAQSRFGNSASIKFTLAMPSGGGTMLESWASTTKQTRSRWKAGVKQHERLRNEWNRRQPAILLRWR